MRTWLSCSGRKSSIFPESVLKRRKGMGEKNFNSNRELRPCRGAVPAGLAGLGLIHAYPGLGLIHAYPGLPSLCENGSYASLGLSQFHLHPGLPPWAVFWRRFVARNYDSLAACVSEFEFLHRLLRPGLRSFHHSEARVCRLHSTVFAPLGGPPLIAQLV